MCCLLAQSLITRAQTPGDSTATANISVSGFTDAYYAYSLNKPSTNQIPFVSNHNRHNEFNVNLMLISVLYNSENVRANLGFHGGTYSKMNYAAEPLMLQHIFQASAGMKLGGKIWLDAGIFPSHIGCESPVSNTDWTLTRSTNAENTPSYETGAKLTFVPTSKWNFSALVLNGWQNMIDNNSNKALGTQVIFTPSDKITINSSSFIGEGHNLPDSLQRIRYFHDFFTVFQLNEKFAVTFLLDNGFEEKMDSFPESNWMAYMMLFRYKPANKFAFCFRAERFIDPDGIIVNTGTANNYQVTGLSLNADYSPAKNILLRIEGKIFNSADMIFPKGNNAVTNVNYLLTTSLEVGF